jgi:hypothetical protein
MPAVFLHLFREKINIEICREDYLELNKKFQNKT